LSEIRNTPKNRWFIREKKRTEKKEKRRQKKRAVPLHWILSSFLPRAKKIKKKNTSLGNLNSILAAQLL